MSDFKGTPGPWKVNTIGKHWNNQSLTHIEVTFGIDGGCVCDTVYEMADANLIAAAPELLEAIQDMLSGWQYIRQTHGDLYGVGWDRAEQKAKDALSKALGQ